MDKLPHKLLFEGEAWLCKKKRNAVLHGQKILEANKVEKKNTGFL